jgi:hypothetical protein
MASYCPGIALVGDGLAAADVVASTVGGTDGSAGVARQLASTVAVRATITALLMDSLRMCIAGRRTIVFSGMQGYLGRRLFFH